MMRYNITNLYISKVRLKRLTRFLDNYPNINYNYLIDGDTVYITFDVVHNPNYLHGVLALFNRFDINKLY